MWKKADMNTSGKIITGFLTGTLLGIVAGLLVAPSTGKKFRKDIQKKSKKLTRQLSAYVGMSNKTGTRSAPSKNGKATVAAS
ncbi:MAG TPA: YtxH domain-containing protein [Chryseosolibacter sp.]